MFERFTDEARRVMVLAEREAREMQHAHVGTEHLLVALADEPEILALGLDRERARAEVVKTVGLGDADGSGELPFTAAAKEALEDALREAMGIGYREIGPGHLLLAVLKQRDGVARRILVSGGATPSELRREIVNRLRTAPPPAHVRVETPAGEVDAVTSALGRALLGDFGQPEVDVRLLISIVRAGGPVGRFLSERGLSEDYLRSLF